MSTASSALRSFDPTAVPEPVLRRRRSARAARNFTLVRGVRRPSSVREHGRRTPAETAARSAAITPTQARRSTVRSIVVQSAPPAVRPAAPAPGDMVRRAIAFAPPEEGGRRTRPFDLTDAELDLAFATVPRTEPVRRRREIAPGDRGPRRSGPPSELSLYARGSVRGGVTARGVHPMRRVEQAQRGFAALAVTALVTALIVVAFLGLAHLRAGSFGDRVEAPVPGISEYFPAGGLPEPVR
ncbi:hypothetical protein BOX37_20735 [Nocardia mangyaensis]|uniref:Uncharacterized protein n=1 Tax=Nocardia mangyaensis TaxID=2213200 RepID=A0A1J0VVD7_9NOCA|nr:hypothetical protein [Nocardia mangyaensis]APE35961.1 hypothetical protein BOX37_20735 [Nocardia mangyaensis]